MWDGINTRKMLEHPAQFIIDGQIQRIFTGFPENQSDNIAP